MTTAYSIQPLTAPTWDAFAGLVERHNGIFGGCWCTYFHPDCAERQPGYEGSRALKKLLVEAGEAHAAMRCPPVFSKTRASAGHGGAGLIR